MDKPDVQGKKKNRDCRMMKDQTQEWINTPTHTARHRQTSKEQLQHQQPTLSSFVPSISDNLDKALRSSCIDVKKKKHKSTKSYCSLMLHIMAE